MTTIQKQSISKNSIFFIIRNYDGEKTAILTHEHDGSFESMIEVAGKLHSNADVYYEWKTEIYHINSQTFATKDDGTAWVLSPNLKHIAQAETKEARYILGDLNCREEEGEEIIHQQLR